MVDLIESADAAEPGSILTQVKLRYGLIVVVLCFGALLQAWSTHQTTTVGRQISENRLPALLAIQDMNRAFADMDTALLRYVLGYSEARVEYLQAADRLRRAKGEALDNGFDPNQLSAFEGSLQVYEDSATSTIFRGYDPAYAARARRQLAGFWDSYSLPVDQEIDRQQAASLAAYQSGRWSEGAFLEINQTLTELEGVHRRMDRILARHAAGDDKAAGEFVGALGEARAVSGKLSDLVDGNNSPSQVDPSFLTELVIRYGVEADAVMAASATDDTGAAVSAVLAMEEQSRAIVALINDLAEVEQLDVVNRTTRLRDLVRQLRIGEALAAASVLVMLLLTARWLQAQVLQPLLELGADLDLLGSGRRDLAFADSDRDDEVGRAFTNLSQLQTSLTDLEQVNREQLSMLETSHVASLQAAYDELAHKEAELRRESSSLQALNMELEQFVFITSHDLRAPLKNIYSLCDLAMATIQDSLDNTITIDTERGAASHENTEQVREFLAGAMSNAERLVQLIDDLRILTKADPSGLETSTVRVDSIVYSCLADRAAEIDGGLRHVHVDDLGEIECYPTLLRQAIENLVENAIKYSATGHRIEFRRIDDGDDDMLTFSVTNQRRTSRFRSALSEHEDFGDRLLLPFVRGSDSETDGTGIGLAICRRVIEVHGGQISIDDANPVEFTARIRLPLQAAPRTERSEQLSRVLGSV